MAIAKSASSILAGAVVISFAATMIAVWSFTDGRVAFGAFDLAIAAVSLLTYIAVRAQALASG